MNRLPALLRALGPLGALAIGVLAFCLAYDLAVLRPAERILSARRAATAERALRPAASDRAESDLRRFYALFPPLERATDELERLFALARDAQVELRQGEFHLERGPRLSAYRVTLPIRGDYAQVRGLAGAILSGMPAASIDGLRIERRNAADTRLDARLQLTLYFRSPGDSP